MAYFDGRDLQLGESLEFDPALEPCGSCVEQAWAEEAKRRLAGIESGERPTVAWEDVERRLLAR